MRSHLNFSTMTQRAHQKPNSSCRPKPNNFAPWLLKPVLQSSACRHLAFLICHLGLAAGHMQKKCLKSHTPALSNSLGARGAAEGTYSSPGWARWHVHPADGGEETASSTAPMISCTLTHSGLRVGPGAKGWTHVPCRWRYHCGTCGVRNGTLKDFGLEIGNLRRCHKGLSTDCINKLSW